MNLYCQSSIQLIEPTADKIILYDNYVYTVIGHVTKAIADIGHEPIITNTTITVYRSYADEEEASEFCKIANSQRLYESLMGDTMRWLLKYFGSCYCEMTPDPITFQTHLTVTKFEYFKNELHGSALEKEMTWLNWTAHCTSTMRWTATLVGFIKNTLRCSGINLESSSMVTGLCLAFN